MRLVVTELSVGFKASPYPGFLTPVFVTCSTEAGEGLVKLITCNDVPGCVEEQQISFCTAVKRLSELKNVAKVW